MKLKAQFPLFILIILCGLSKLQAQDSISVRSPDTLQQAQPVVNALPYSEIDIPVRIALKPMYSWANSVVDTLYTSPDYPNGWVQDGCSVRYQYRFVRGPFNIRAANNALLVGFSGYYGLRGSTRVCTSIGNSPWTPACSCGFGSEKPRRIDAAFGIRLGINSDYSFNVQIARTPSKAIDKCTICFFGKDITQTVAAQVDDELNTSITEMQQQLQQFELRKYFQTLWDSLQTPYMLPGFGYLHLQPGQLRLGQLRLMRDTLFFSLGLTARPELRSEVSALKTSVPNLTQTSGSGGFRVFIAQQLPYDSLSGFVNAQLGGKSYQVGKGLLKRTIQIDSVRMLGGGNKIYLQVHVSKAAKGSFYLEGIPRYDAIKQVLWLDSLDHNISSKQVLVKSAAYLLDGVIAQKLKDLSRFDLSVQASKLVQQLTQQMNRTIMDGVHTRGYLSQFQLNKISAAPGGLQVEGIVAGKLWVEADAGTVVKQMMQ